MNENELFQVALGLLPPWMVDRCTFDQGAGRLDLHLDFPRGGVFPCPLCGVSCKAHGGDPEAVTDVSADMSKAFFNGITTNLPNAAVTFDKFHVVSLVNTAVEKVRRIEQKACPCLLYTSDA